MPLKSWLHPKSRPAQALAALAVAPAALLLAAATAAAASPAGPAAKQAAAARPIGAPQVRRAHYRSHFTVRQILFGINLEHSYRPAGSATRLIEPLTQPDDLTALGPDLFTGFQNGIGATGGASSDGNLDSTIVEFTPAGQVVRQWDIKGKCDGLTADPATGQVIATVNEDGNSSVYIIAPGRPARSQLAHYSYNEALPSNGGTDAISIYHGRVLLSASAPGTTGQPAPQPGYPAAYSVRFSPASHRATITPLFSDEAPAVTANLGTGHGTTGKLALVDPDSSAVVPPAAFRFRGDFMLDSQGDQEQIYSHPAGQLSVLHLSQAVDDTAWVTRRSGRLYAADGNADTVDVITGRFVTGRALVAVTPCDAGNAPATCPAPGFPVNYLGSLNQFTGHVSRVPVRGPLLQPKGMLYVP